jgi:hypothetical protein
MYVLNILNMLHIPRFFSSKCRLFHNATFFDSCIIHILHTGCAKIKKKSGAKRLSSIYAETIPCRTDNGSRQQNGGISFKLA